MNITQEQKEFIENIIKECSCYKDNEYLLDEFCNEVIRRAYSLFSNQDNLDSIRVYLKRIANIAMLDVIKNADKYVTDKYVEAQEPVSIGYEFDENGDIALNYDIPFEEAANNRLQLTQDQITQIKDVVCSIDENSNSALYKDIFELRYIKGLNNSEIAEKLEIKETDVDKKLLFLLGRVKETVNLK